MLFVFGGTLGISPLCAQEVLTLQKALSIAETGSPDLKQSLLNLTISQKNLEAQKAGLKSSVSLGLDPVSYSNARRFDTWESEWYTNRNFESSSSLSVVQPIVLTDGTLSLTNEFGWSSSKSTLTSSETKSDVFFNDLYLTLSQPLFTYNTTKQELKELELSLENANISYALERLNVEKTVTQYFYTVYMAQMDLVIAKEELANTQSSYDIIVNKVEAGLAAKEEQYQAELNLATAKSEVQNYDVEYENAKDQLKLYLGMDLFEDITILANVNANPVPVNLDKAIENGLKSRMELRQREIDIETSQFDLIETMADNEFEGSVSLRVGITGDDEKIRNVLKNPTRSPSVSVSFDIPIFDWGERKANIAAAEANIQSQELSLIEERNEIIVDIREVYRNIQNELLQIEIAEQNQRNAQLTYEINLERYENGDLTGMDLNLYQTQLSEKKIALSQALINYKIELLNLKIQSLYDFETGEEILPEELFLDVNNNKTRKK